MLFTRDGEIKRRQKVFMSKEMLLRIEQKKLQEAAKNRRV